MGNMTQRSQFYPLTCKPDDVLLTLKSDQFNLFFNDVMVFGEYPYFIAAHSPEDTGNPQSVEQDYKRMEALSNGAYHLIGIQAGAEITLTGSTTQRLTSGGLWGVESDAGEPCLQTFEKEELEDLKEELLAVGFSEENIADAFAKPLRSQDY